MTTAKQLDIAGEYGVSVPCIARLVAFNIQIPNVNFLRMSR